MLKFFKDAGNAYIEAKLAKARYELAVHLTETNPDFKGMSVGEVFTKLQQKHST